MLHFNHPFTRAVSAPFHFAKARDQACAQYRQWRFASQLCDRLNAWPTARYERDTVNRPYSIMVAYAQRLSNLSQTDLAPLLPLPIVAEPRDASDEAGPPPQMHYDPGVLQEVVALLRACDSVSLYVSYRCLRMPCREVGKFTILVCRIPKLSATVLSSGPGQYSELQQAVLKIDPNAFATESLGALMHMSCFPTKAKLH